MKTETILDGDFAPVSSVEESSAIPHDATLLGKPVLGGLVLAIAAYLLQAGIAIATGRHLFGDGSWFLLRLLAENHITHLNNNTWNDFFVGRLGAFTYQQFPTLVAARMGVHSLNLLSVIF